MKLYAQTQKLCRTTQCKKPNKSLFANNCWEICCSYWDCCHNYQKDFFLYTAIPKGILSTPSSQPFFRANVDKSYFPYITKDTWPMIVHHTSRFFFCCCCLFCFVVFVYPKLFWMILIILSRWVSCDKYKEIKQKEKGGWTSLYRKTREENQPLVLNPVFKLKDY